MASTEPPTLPALAHFSIRLPSAGTFYTFISQGLGPSTGFVTGWLLFQALLAGSVAHNVLHYAHCPVLIVR